MNTRWHTVRQRCRPDATPPLGAASWRAASLLGALLLCTTTASQASSSASPSAASSVSASVESVAPPSIPNAVTSAQRPDAQPAQRVITLAPHVTELVFAAGGAEKMVATVNSSNYPSEALSLPRVGDGLSINAEQLLSLQPDLIVGWHNTMAIQKLTPMLRRLAIPVVFSEPRYLDQIPADIERLGLMMGTQTQADASAAELREQLATLRHTYARRTLVPVYIEVGTGPLYTLGNDTLTNDAITACGGVNVFHDSALVAPAVTVESVLARDPKVVIIANGKPARVRQRTTYWKELHLSAAQQGHVYGIHPDTLVRPGPRLIQATQELCEKMDRARSQD